jgi:hypothetical protein
MGVGNLAGVYVGENVTFAFLVLNTTLLNTGVEHLPFFTIEGTFNGVAFSTNRNHLFTHTFTVPSEGIHDISVSLDGAIDDLNFTALKRETKVIVHDVEGEEGKHVSLSAKLIDGLDEPLAGKTLRFYVGGHFIGEATTNHEGIATLSHLPHNNGHFTIEVSFAGDSAHNPSNGHGVLEVSETPDDPDNPDNPDNPDDPDDPDVPGNPDDSSNVSASMKSTGIPIQILLVLVILGLLPYCRRK